MTDFTPAETFQISAQQAAILSQQQYLGQPLAAQALLSFDTPPERAVLQAALNELCQRHEILRTTYRQMPGFKQPVQDIAAQVRLRLILEPGRSVQQARAEDRLALAEVPLVASLLDRQLLVSVALASCDRQSLAQLMAELQQLCAGGQLQPFDGLQYADYAAWQGELSEQAIGREGLQFWRTLYAERQAGVRLPFERRLDFAPQLQECRLDTELAPTLRQLAGAAQLSVEDSLLFLWAGFLAGLSQQDSLLVALTVDGRSDQLQQTLGHFSRRLPVAVALQPQATLQDNLQAFRHQLDLSRSWQDCLNELDVFGAEQPRPLDLGCSYIEGSEAQELFLDQACFEKLHLWARADADRLSLQLSWQPRLLPEGLPEAWLEQFAQWLKAAAADSSLSLEQLPLVSGDQAQRLLQDFDRSADLSAADAPLLHQLFEEAARAYPQRAAIHVDGLEVTYAELDRQANQLAHRLREQGVDSDAIVGVYGARSIEIVVALLGILKAGGAYLPLDPAYPSERLSFMLEDSAVRCLISLQPLHPDLVLAADLPLITLDPQLLSGDAQAPASNSTADNLAYVIYTSGSTGRPKGVMVSHANASTSTLARGAFYQAPLERFLMLSSFSFDSSVAGIFWTLSQGATLYLPSEEQHKDPQQVAGLIDAQRISHFLALPSFYAQILEALQQPQLRCVIVAGEACPVELAVRHRELLPETLLVNEYGPSESAVWCSAFAVTQAPVDERVAIGGAIAGTRLRVLDEEAELAGIGREGELFIGGPGLARGYLKRPGLTASRFLPDPFATTPGARLYRTGDRVSSLPQGRLDYLGRIDFQLKIRGFRIELGEIESLLGQAANVREAAVVARDTVAGKQLVAYVVLARAEDREAQEQVLLAQLREQLPEYMVPAFISVLERFPLTPNGKLDRNALSALELQGSAYVAPRNELEATLAAIWQEALQLERVGVHDNFFALGGHSLLATRIRSKVQSELNLSLPLRVFFEGETVELLARQVELHRDSEVTGDKVDALEALFAEAQE